MHQLSTFGKAINTKQYTEIQKGLYGYHQPKNQFFIGRFNKNFQQRR